MKNTFLFFCLLIFSTSAISQHSNKNRLNNSPEFDLVTIEKDIAQFIEAKWDKFELPAEIINNIQENIGKEADENHAEFSPVQIQKTIDLHKKYELTKLYFDKYPEIKKVLSPVTFDADRQLACENGGFESGYTNYTFTTIPYSNGPPNVVNPNVNVNTGLFGTLSPSATLNDPISLATLVDNTSLVSGTTFTPILTTWNSNYPVYIPRTFGGSSRAIRLNRETSMDGNFDITAMSRVFTIDENYFTFNFSAVLLHPFNHSQEEQPFFTVRIYDAFGNQVATPFEMISDPSDPRLLHVGPTLDPFPLLYTGWINASIDTSNLISQTVRVEFIIGDCGRGGDWGAVYIDDICGNDEESCPTFGLINLNPIESICEETISVCGTFITPSCHGDVHDIVLNIKQGGDIINTLNSPVITGNSFCFTVNISDFGPGDPNGAYEFEAAIRFDIPAIGAGTYTTTPIFDHSANDPGNDVVFADCCFPTLTTGVAITAIGDVHVQRENWIKSTNDINNPSVGSQVVYHAGDYIELNPGFISRTGSHFKAYIEECTNTFTYRMNQNGVSDGGEAAEINMPSNIESHAIKIYPNPSNKIITVFNQDARLKTIKILSMDGKIMFDQNADSNSQEIDVSGFAKGIYLITVQTEEGKILRNKFIKN